MICPTNISTARRILVLGCCGSGKSTFAYALSQKTGLPVIHIDQMFWSEGWVERPKDEYQRLLQEAINQDKWIMDGNHSTSLEQRLQHADIVIMFKYPLYLCFYRIFKRILTHHGKTRPDMAAGCPERLSWEFLQYVWRFPKDSQPKLENIISAATHLKDHTFIFTNPRDAERFLAQIA